jgi:hypothetical protein
MRRRSSFNNRSLAVAVTVALPVLSFEEYLHAN